MKQVEFYVDSVIPYESPVYCCSICKYAEKLNGSPKKRKCVKHDRVVHILQCCGYFVTNRVRQNAVEKQIKQMVD